jgi:transposase
MTGRILALPLTRLLTALAHVGHWQGRRARYPGRRKNLFDLRRTAGIHHLHVRSRRGEALQHEAA